jgi:tight adherence protein B
MNHPTIAWLALALGILFLPSPSPVATRVFGLADAGRLVAADRSPRTRPRRAPPTWTAATACGAAALAAGWRIGAAIGVATGLATATSAWLIASMLARRRDTARRRALLSAVRVLAAELGAGSRPAAALSAAAEVAPEHREVFTVASGAASTGADVAPLLATMPELGGLARAWHVGSAAGVPLADVLARVADDLAAREQQRRSVSSVLAGPRASAALLAGLPVLGVGLGAALGAHPVATLLGSSGGRLLCCVGVALDAVGVLWTARLILRAERW